MARQSVKTVSPDPKSKLEDRKRKRTGLRVTLKLSLVVDSGGPPPVDGSPGNPPPPKPPGITMLRGVDSDDCEG